MKRKTKAPQVARPLTRKQQRDILDIIGPLTAPEAVEVLREVGLKLVITSKDRA